MRVQVLSCLGVVEVGTVPNRWRVLLPLVVSRLRQISILELRGRCRSRYRLSILVEEGLL